MNDSLKVLIIDNRPQRKYSSGYRISMEDIKSVELYTKIGLDSTTVEDLKNELLPFSLIAIHRSYLTENDNIGINDLMDYAKENKDKYFIIFSGGITQNIISENILYINAGDFYSENLSNYLQKYMAGKIDYPLQQFLYGNSWRLPFLFELRQYLWLSKFQKNNQQIETIVRVLGDKFKQATLDGINKEIKREILNFYSNAEDIDNQ